MVVSKVLNPPKNNLGVMGQNPRLEKVDTGSPWCSLAGQPVGELLVKLRDSNSKTKVDGILRKEPENDL